jgi:uncharacterized protein YgiM (DUF1202 family)
MRFLGYPYSATGASPQTGFSCIGFASYVYHLNGIPLPGDLGDALAYAPRVPFSDLQPGDLLYFQNTVWNGLSHVAIYIGGGKFIHAEWYNRGVVISSFNNDPVDGNYWIGKYLGANRPWGGAAGEAVVTPPVSGNASSGGASAKTPTTSAVTQVVSGPSAVVTVSSLNVRSGPSMNHSVQQVIQQGTTVTIIGKRNGWYKVQLPDGTIGWVIAQGIGRSGASSSSASASASSSSATVVSVTGSNGVNATVGTPTAPTQVGTPARVHVRATASATVSGLRVHTSPSTDAPVITSVSPGQKLQVIGRKNGWIEVRMPDGTVGWVSSAYTAVKSKAGRPAPAAGTTSSTSTVVKGTAVKQVSASGAATTAVAVHVRSAPSLSASIITTLPSGGSYQVIGRSNGWLHVQLSNGVTGWISAAVLGGPSSYNASTTRSTTRRSASSARSYSASTKTSGGSSVVTAGVRVHSAPGVNAPVVGMVAAGTHVTVLGYKNGWALVRLPSGQTGYVLGSYVR